MGVLEVWVYRDGAFAIHVPAEDGKSYDAGTTSLLMPGVEFALLARLVVRKDAPQALREFEKIIRGG
jgi:hypothetical protein